MLAVSQIDPFGKVDSLILWVAVGVIAFAVFAWRMQRAKQKAAAERAAREAIAAATLDAAKAEVRAQADAARLEAERKAASKARREAARATADRILESEAERVRSLRASRTAEAERAAREAARRAVLEANQDAAEAARRPAADDAAPASPPAPAAPAAFKSPQETLILVADDSKVVRLKAGRLLAKDGYRIVYAVDGEDALRQVADEVPDLVVTDVEMPHLDGFGLTRALRGTPRTAHVPIVMITSTDAIHREAAMREGVGLVLGKPFPEEPLLAHVRSFRFPSAARPSAPVDRPDFAQTDAGAFA